MESFGGEVYDSEKTRLEGILGKRVRAITAAVPDDRSP